MLRIYSTLFAAAIVITGCRPTRVPSTVPQPVTTSTANDTLSKSIGSWILTPTRQQHTYHSITQTTVRERIDPTGNQKSIERTTAFTISFNQLETSLNISGHIDTVRFSPQNQLEANDHLLTLPLSFEGELGPVALAITAGSPQRADGSCSAFISSILSDLHAVVAIYPMHLTPGLTWRDSTLVSTCTTGGVPTTRKTIQSFRVMGERAFNTTRALLIQRVDSTHITGDGTEGNHQVHLEGFGTTTANIYISTIAAVTLGVDLFEKTEIAITNSGKTRHFTQEVTQKLGITN